MAQTFQPGLFSQSSAPVGGTKSGVPTSGIQAISKATTLQDENPFDSISDAFRQRKRRKVAEELHGQGITPDDPVYFSTFRDKLIEFGDNQGAEMVETKRMEQQVSQSKIDLNESLIDRRGAQSVNDAGKLKDRQNQTATASLNTNSQIDKRTADIENDIKSIDAEILRAGIAQQNATSTSQRVAISRRLADLQGSRDEQTNRLREAQAKGQELSNDFLDRTGYLPGRSAAAGAAKKVGSSDVKLKQARSLISQLTGRLTTAAKDDANFIPGIPGDSVSGIEGWMRKTFGGLINQINPDWDPSKGADLQEQGYQYLQSLLVPILMNEKRISNSERERVEAMVGKLTPGKNNLQNQRVLKQLNVFIDGMEDLGPDEFNDGMGPGSDVPDTSAQSIPDQPPLDFPNARRAPDGNWYVEDPNRPGKFSQVIP